MKKNNYSYIALLLIVVIPFGVHASFGDALRANWQNINIELDIAGNQVATTLLSLNAGTPVERGSDRLQNQNPVETMNAGQMQNGSMGQGAVAGEGFSTTESPLINPTFCNVEILLPQANQVIPSSFTTAGLIGQQYQGVCAWTVFEANAGEVQVFDANNNAVSHIEQLESVGDWMQIPSSFESSIVLTAVPRTQTGYIRYTEHPVQDGVVADTFDLPIRFEIWQEVRQPGTQTFFGRFFTNIANLFTGKPMTEKGIVKSTPKPKNNPTQNNPEVTKLGDTVSDIEKAVEQSNFSGQLYCEIKLPDESKFCSGNRIDVGTCECDTFYFKDGIQKPIEQKSSLDVGSANIDATLFTPKSQVALTKTLYFGDRGEEVRMLESAMYYLGYYKNPPLGLFNNDLRLAVKAFMKDHQENVTGFIITQKIRDIITKEVEITTTYPTK